MKWLAVILFSIFLLQLEARENEEAHIVKIELSLICPESNELQDLTDAISSKQGQYFPYEEWEQYMVDGMNKLALLLETRKIYQGNVSLDHEIKALNEISFK